MKPIAKFHYITNSDFLALDQLRLLAKAGGSWVQLRIKERVRAERELPKLVEEAKHLGLTVIVNDYLDLVLELEADGVHLGKRDATVEQARALLGPDKIVGVTINTPEDLTSVMHQSISYLGLGPLRYTSTKRKLEPLLGLEGVRKVCSYATKLCPGLPLVVVGGVVPQDVGAIISAGAHGVAVSSAITRAGSPVDEMKLFLKLVDGVNDGAEITAG